MRDDIDKLPIPASAKRYARMSGSKWLGAPKQNLFMQVNSDLAHQGKKETMSSQDKAGKIAHTFKESAQSIVDGMLEDEDDVSTKSFTNPIFRVVYVEGGPSDEVRVDVPSEVKGGVYHNYMVLTGDFPPEQQLKNRLDILVSTRNYPENAVFSTPFGQFQKSGNVVVKI